MSAMLSWMRRHQITEVILFLLVVALVAGLTGCVGEAGPTVKYDLTIASGEGGSVTEPGEGTFTADSGRVVDLVATPTSGYRFLKWTGSVATIANPNAASTTITMNGNYSITATFEETEATFYTLTMAVTGSGSTSPAVGQHTYAGGAVVSVSAAPASGYQFVNWIGDVSTIGDPDSASTTITIYGDYSITAKFEAIPTSQYSVTVYSTTGGSVTITVGGEDTVVGPGQTQTISDITAGTAVDLVATPDTIYHFVNWTGAPVNGITSTAISFSMQSDYSITANFMEGPPPLPGQHSLTVYSTTGGSVTITVGGEDTVVGPGQTQTISDITAGTAVDLVATPDTIYHFVSWTGAPVNGITSTAISFSMQSDYSITANFAAGTPEYDLTISSTTGGSVTITVGGEDTVVGPGQTQTISDITAGTAVDLVATPDTIYHFVNWTGAPVNGITSTAISFSMESDYSITANFAAGTPEYDLTISSTTGGSVTITVGGEDTVVGPGQTQTISDITAGTGVDLAASPNVAYHFVNWTGAPVNGITSTAISFSMESDYSITANFAAGTPEYDLTISSTAGGSVTTPGEGTFTGNAGTVVSLVASPGTGYRFAYWICQAGTIADLKAASTTITMNGNYEITAVFVPRFMAAAGGYHTVGLRTNGSAVAVGYNGNGQCNVGGWTDIIQVAAGDLHTVGLRSNGTVVAVGDNSYGQCNVGGWTNIVQIATSAHHTVGLRADGTVVATGDNSYGQCNVGGWTNIVQIAAGAYHTVGLKSDSTAVATGYNYYGQCGVASWTNLIQVSAGLYHSVGLESDGTVVAAGDNGAAQSNVSGWTNIIQVCAGWLHTVGLRANGTVVAVGYNGYGQRNVGSWTNIVQVSAGQRHTVGVRSGGTAVAVGYQGTGQCNVGGWDLN